MKKNLFLFDIDGTLIRTNGAGRETIRFALEELFGAAGPVETYKFSGKTDPRIIIDLMTAVGIPREEVEAKLTAVYELMAQKGQEIFAQRGMRPCTGVPDLLAALKERDDVVLGLLTGNSQITAPIKLYAAGIDPDQFIVGAYGSDAMNRNELPQIGMARAKQLTGHSFNGKNTVIIGDTPADIRCARAGKAKAVVVASGWHTAEALAQYQPDHLFDNLSDTEEVLRILFAAQEDD